MDEPKIVDEFAVITECDLYTSFYNNDFKWNQVRKAVRQAAVAGAATYPDAYHYNAKLQLDRYDFTSQTFRFTRKSIVYNVNSFMLYSVQGDNCGSANVKYLPRNFRAILSTPIYMDGLPLSQAEGDAVLKLMEADHNNDRFVYVRFNIRIGYIEPFHKTVSMAHPDIIEDFKQPKAKGLNEVTFDAVMESMEFFEDAEMTRLIYQYKP